MEMVVAEKHILNQCQHQHHGYTDCHVTNDVMYVIDGRIYCFWHALEMQQHASAFVLAYNKG